MSTGRGRTPITLACALVALVMLLAPAAAQADPVCDPAVAMDDVHSGNAGNTQLNCDDSNGAPISYYVDPSDDADHGFVSVDEAGSVTYTSNFDYAGPDSWTVIADNNEGGTYSISMSIEVVNQAPVCLDTTIETQRGQTGFANAQCSDPDGDMITIGVNPAQNGTSGEQFGFLSYDPDVGFAGSDQFTYYATDSVESGEPATVDVTVTNAAPACDVETTPASSSLRTGKPLTVRVSCDDGDGDYPLDIDVASGPAHGTLGEFAFNPDTFAYEAMYTPDDLYTGPDHFTFSANDGLASSDPYDFDLEVTENHAPKCSDPGADHAKVGQTVTVFLFCSDPDPNDAELDYSVASGPAHGSLGTIADSQVDYTPASRYSGGDSFTVLASDGDMTDHYDQVMHVANTPLCTTPPPVSIRAGKSRDLEVDCTVPNDDFGTRQYEVVTQPSQGTLNPSGSTFSAFRTYTAGGNATGSDSYSVRLTSSQTGSSPDVTQSITTGPAVNNPPECSDAGSTPGPVYAGRSGPLFIFFCSDPDGDDLSFSVPTQPEHGTSSSVDGHIEYTADADYVGPDEIPFTVSDGHGGSTESAQAVEVRAPEVPSCTQGPVSFTMRPGSTREFQIFCMNPQGDDQTYAVSGAGPAHGSVEIDEDGVVTYTADGDATGSDSFQLKASNEVGDSADQPVTITFDPEFNRAPVCNPFGVRVVASGVSTPMNLGAVCTDPDGDPMQFERVNPPANGSLTAGPAATLTYRSTNGYLGPDQFTFRARDDRDAESGVTPRNLDVRASVAPTCTQFPPLNLRPGQTRVWGFNCSDPNNEELTYKIVSPPNGSIAPPGDSTTALRSYTAPDAEGTDDFTFKATNESGLDSPVYTQNVNVDPTANEEPQCFDNAPVGPQSVARNHPTTMGISQFCSDPDGDPLTFTRTSFTDPQHGTTSESGGAIIYTSTGTYLGPDSFSYLADDGHGGTAMGTFSLNVLGTSAPVCDDVSESTGVGTPVEVQLTCTDPDPSDSLTLSASDESHGSLDTVDQETGTVTFTPDDGYAGPASFTYFATDDHGVKSDLATVSIDVESGKPSCDDVDTSTKAGTPVQVSLACTDPDSGDTLTLAASGASHGSLGSVDQVAKKVTFTPAAGYIGAAGFSYKATDSHGVDSDAATVSIDVASGKPSCDDVDTSTKAGTPVQVSLACTDPDSGDTLTLAASGASHGSLGSVDQVAKKVTFTPAAGYIGAAGFSYKATDSHGVDSDAATVSIDVESNKPSCDDVDTSTKAGTPVQVSLACTDPDSGDTLTLAASGASHGSLGSVDQVAKKVTFTPAAGYIGAAGFSYKATDSHGVDSDAATVSIDVESNKPSCDDVDTSTKAGTPVQVSLACTDPDSGDTLTLATSGASHGSLGSVDQVAKKVTFTPAAGYIGAAGFSYKATDSHGVDSDAATVSIDVESNKPSCDDVNATTTADTPVQVDLTCADPDSGDTLTLSASGASHGTLGSVDQVAKKVTFTPDSGYVGPAGFSYKATDSHGVESDSATAAITVNAAPGGGDPGGGDPGGGDPGGGDPGGGDPGTGTPGGGTPGGGGDPGAGNPGGGTPPDLAAPTLGLAPLPKQKLTTVLKKGFGVTVSCSETCVATLKLTIAKKLAKKLGITSADVTLGSVKKTISAGQAKLYVKLSAGARKRLKKARSVKLKLVLRATDAAGNASTKSRTLTLKR